MSQQRCCVAQSLDIRNGMYDSYCTTFWTLDKLVDRLYWIGVLTQQA